MKNKKSKSIIAESLKRAMKKSKALTAALLLTVLLSVLLVLLPPLVLENVINKLTTGGDIAVSLAVLYFVLIALSGLSDSLKEVLITGFGQKITHSLRSMLCKKLSRLTASYFTANEAGKTTSRIVNDVDTVEGLFTNGIIIMFSDVCKVIAIIGIIFVKNPGLGVIILVSMPLIFFLTRYFQKRMLRAQSANRSAIAKVNNYIPETIKNIRTIRIMSKQKYMERRYGDVINDGYIAVDKINLYDSLYSPIIVFICAFITSAVMVLSATSGDMRTFFGMSVGTAVAVISYISKVFSPIESIGMEIQSIQSAMAGIRRIKEMMDEPERHETVSEISADFIGRKGDCVSFENVTFGYTPEQKVLDGLSFTVKRGDNVTLTGRTGAGKSTIFKLLLGLYSPDCGAVRIFGMAADDIPDSEKRKLFGYVEQAFMAVPGSIADQISLLDDEIERDKIESAAKMVGLHETIMALPKGYDTPYANSAFSQGQTQLLSIARAVVSDPEIMLLDEITANLDSVTEEQVLTALERASGGRTVISISHRLYKKTSGRLINI